MTLEERVREDIINESDQLRTFWFEKIIPLLKKCKRKEGNLRGAIFDKETLKDFNDLNGLFREYRRRMRRMIAGMEEVNEFKKEVDPESKDKIFSDVEIGLYRFYFKQYKELTKNWVRQYQTSMISF